jgi:hypothetical protein
MTDRRTFLFSDFKGDRPGMSSHGWTPEFRQRMADHFYGFATVTLEDNSNREGDNHDSMVFEPKC